MSYSKQRGTAIVTVLLVLAVISVIATSLMVQQRIDIRRTQQIVTANQAYRYAQGVTYWAIGVIKQDNEQNTVIAKSKEEWTQKLEAQLTRNSPAIITGELLRLEQRININALGVGTITADFLSYLKENFPEMGDKAPTELIRQINNWVKDNNTKEPDPTSLGENSTDLDSDYQKLNPPYRVAHSPMVSQSEMRLLKGVDADLYQKLLLKLVALPSLEASSNAYYFLQTDVKLGDQSLRVYSLLKRVVDNNGSPKVLVLYEARGTL